MVGSLEGRGLKVVDGQRGAGDRCFTKQMMKFPEGGEAGKGE